MIEQMKNPIEKGTRVVLNGNLQPYAKAIVVDTVFRSTEARWEILLEWPNTPGGPSKSRVWDSDEGKTWVRFSSLKLPN